MSDEEMKAIDWFREDLAEEKENCGKYNDYKKQMIRRNERLLNLIEKQSKEIEELKDTRSIFNMGRRSYKNEIEDKIKAKIEEYKNKIKKIRNKKLINEPEDTINITRYVHYISVLQSLLEKE